MMISFKRIVLISPLLCSVILSHELCIDTSGPAAQELSFCNNPSAEYEESSCCNLERDTEIKTEFNAKDFGDSTACAAHVRAMLCAECDPWSAHLFGAELDQARESPYLCSAFCSQVYTDCSAVPYSLLPNIPGYPSSSDTVATLFPNEASFCNATALNVPGVEVAAYCYSGQAFTLPQSDAALNSSSNVCTKRELENVAVDLKPFPNNSSRFVLVSQGGTIEAFERDNDTDDINSLGLFFDISSLTRATGEQGLLGANFHPQYGVGDENRLFVRFSCNNNNEECRVSCSTAADCGHESCDDGFCRGHTEFLESYEVSNLFAENPVRTASSFTRRTILKVPQPYGNHNGGEALFGPDGYLYVFMGDGGSGNDPQKLSQNLQTFLGKALRINVDASDQGKNYSVPTDNPFVDNNEILPEIYAYGLRNPWRCSFDSARPQYLFCGDVGQNNIEEISLISKGGNYGWRTWEGSRLNFNEPLLGPSGHTGPILEYGHNGGAASVTGGYVVNDPDLKGENISGNYFFADLYGTYYEGVENPPSSGNFTMSAVSTGCTNRSGLACPVDSGLILSFGEDGDKRVYILTTTGVYSVVSGEMCDVFTSSGNAFKVTSNWLLPLLISLVVVFAVY